WTMRGNLKQPNSKRETHNSRSHWVAAWNAQGEILHPEIAVYQEKVIREVKSGKKDKYNHWDLNYESRKPEITNTIIDAKVTAFLPENVLTIGGQFQHAELRDDSATGKKTT
ncbi:TonB-dependent receptor, partial [Escherichia coli]|nr:TonB-dependent receptor [Escherichia coli]